MSKATTQTQDAPRNENRPMCAWKIVLLDNLRGKGTSFDLGNLSYCAARCLGCDGFAGECCFYTF